MAELPATGSLGTGQLDTRDLLVAGVPISISSKYLYLYLALKLLTKKMVSFPAGKSPPQRSRKSGLLMLFFRNTGDCGNIVIVKRMGNIASVTSGLTNL